MRRLAGTTRPGLALALLTALAGCDRGEEIAGAPDAPDATEITTSPPPTFEETGDTVEPVDYPETGTTWRTVMSNAGAWKVHWRATSEPVPLNEPFGLQVAVWDGGTDEFPPDDVTMTIDARMPDHRHGMLREPTVTRLGPGQWSVDGMLCHMPGYWEIHVDVTRGARTERAQIPIEID